MSARLSPRLLDSLNELMSDKYTPSAKKLPGIDQMIHDANKMQINFVEDDFVRYNISRFAANRIEMQQQTLCRRASIHAQIEELVSRLAVLGGTSVCTSDSYGFCIANDQSWVAEFNVRKWTTEVDVYGDKKTTDRLITEITRTFANNPCYVKWVYDPQHLEYMTVPVNHDNLPVEEMYPFLNGESLSSYYDRFMASSANILVLIGVPGSGKTSFIRGMLSHTRKSAMLAYHQKILEQDAFFVQWIEGKDTFMILEDSDTLLLSREDGNDMMARFLNLGDGLMSFSGKKMIFSTNLPNVNDIDPALIRPGRCFDIVEFSRLNRQQAHAVASKFNLAVGDEESFTVGELFAQTKNEMKQPRKSGFGFTG